MWTIKDVERMTGLPKDDIQRVCDVNNAKTFIFCPRDSRPGRRYFEQEDIKKVWLIAQYKRMGYNLPEIASIFKEAEERQLAFSDQISVQIEELESRKKELEEQIGHAKKMQEYVKASSDAQEGFLAFMARSLFPEFFEHMFSLILDEDAEQSIEAFHEYFKETTGAPFDEWLDNYFIEDSQAMGVEACQSPVVNEIESALSGKDSLSDDEAYALVDSVIRSLSKSSPREGDTSEMLTWLFFEELLEMPEIELWVALGCGPSVYDYVLKVWKGYGKNRWGETESKE